VQCVHVCASVLAVCVCVCVCVRGRDEGSEEGMHLLRRERPLQVQPGAHLAITHFDDIGCLIQHLAGRRDACVHGFIGAQVHGYTDRQC